MSVPFRHFYCQATTSRAGHEIRLLPSQLHHLVYRAPNMDSATGLGIGTFQGLCAQPVHRATHSHLGIAEPTQDALSQTGVWLGSLQFV